MSSPTPFRRVALVALVALAFAAATPLLRAAETPAMPAAAGCFYVDYRGEVPAAKAGAFPVAILHPDVKTDLAAIRRSGSRALAYISIGEMASDAPYRGQATGLPLLGRNEAWKSDIVDLRDARWR